MRWKFEWVKKRKPKHGDKRVVRRFLLFPTKPLKEDHYRWLETVTVKQQFGIGIWSDGSWIDIKFIDEEQND